MRSKLLKGNWFEENALENSTGCRYYPDPRDKVNSALLTSARTILMDERVEPKDYRTSQLQINPLNHEDYVPRDAQIGLRQKQKVTNLRDELERKFKKEQNEKYAADRKMNYLSLAAESYRPHNAGFKPLMNMNDPSVRVPTSNTDYAADNPITYYSHEMMRKQKCGFPTTFVRSTNPFRKCTHFSNDIRQSLGKQAETHEKPRHLPTSRDYTILLEMRNRLLSQSKSAIPGATVALILDDLYKLEISTRGKCTIEELRNTFSISPLGIELTNEEMVALSNTFDLDHDGKIYLRELINLFRPSLSARRYELVKIAFCTCDQSNVGFLTEEDMKKFFNNDGFHSFLGESLIASANQAASFFFQSIQEYLGDNNAIDLQDFAEYYSCVSAEISSDVNFEELLVMQWRLPKIEKRE